MGASGRVVEGTVEPEQASGHLRLERELAISHETIYRHIWRDLRSGETLHQHLRGARKSCRKRYGRYGRVFVGHNGAESYYSGRGFRGSLKV